MEQEADLLFNQQHYQEALQLYQKCQQTFQILIRQAEINDTIGQFKHAIKFYQQAFMLNKSNLRTLIKIGKLYTQIGQYEEAIQIYQQAIFYDSKFALAYGELAYTYYCQEDHDQAIENFLKCSELITIVPSFLTQIGDELYSEYKYYTAKLYYSVALKIDQEYKQALLGIIRVFNKIEKYEQSLEICENILQKDPSNIDGALLKSIIFQQLVQNLLEMKKLEEAQTQIDKLNTLPCSGFNDEQEDLLIYQSAKLLFCQSFFQECNRYINEALKRNPYDLNLIVLNGKLFSQIAQCFVKQVCYEEAQQELEKVFDIYYNHYDALQVQYNIQILLNKHEEAQKTKLRIDLLYI